MKDIDYFKGIKIWMISVFSFDLLMILYLFIRGRVLEIEPVFPDLVSVIGFIVLVLSVIVGFGSIIYSIVKKQYDYIIHGIGILLASLILYLTILIIALATIF